MLIRSEADIEEIEFLVGKPLDKLRAEFVAKEEGWTRLVYIFFTENAVRSCASLKDEKEKTACLGLFEVAIRSGARYVVWVDRSKFKPNYNYSHESHH